MLFELGKYSVCIKNRCYPKTTFIKKVFGKGYEKNILNNIFRGKSILSGRDKVSKTIGFTQKIDDDKYHLDYIVAQDKITFTDYNKDIKIIIKTLKD